MEPIIINWLFLYPFFSQEVKRLEEKQSRMHVEIEKMTVERAELQDMLDNHQPNCKMKKSPPK